MIINSQNLHLPITRESFFSVLSIMAVSILLLVSLILPFNIILYVVCLLASGLLILTCPEAGLYTIIFCTMVFERWFTLQSINWGNQIIKLYPLDIIIGFTVLSLFVAWAVNKKKIVLWDKDYGLILWLFIILVVLEFCRTWFTLGVDAELAFSTFKNYAFYLVVYLLVINLIKTPVQFKRLISTFIWAGVFLIYFVVYGWLTGHGVWSETVPLSTWGERLLGGPHTFYLTVLIILLFNLVVWQKRWGLREYFYFLLILIFSLGVLGSLQRHLWLALLLGFGILIYFYPLRQRRQFWRLTALSLIAMLLILFFSFWVYSWQTTNFVMEMDVTQSLKFRVFSFFTSSSLDSSAIWRLVSWQEAWRVFQENWLLGTGLGQKLNFNFGEYNFAVPTRELHNDFIGLTVQMGIAGLAFLFLFGYQLLVSFWRWYCRLQLEYRKYYLAFFTLTIIFLWSANFGTYLDINVLVIFLWLFLGGMSVSRELGSS